MKKYWFFFKLSLQSKMAERADLYLEIVGSLVLTLAVVAVWWAASAGKEGVAGISRGMLVLYLLIAGLLMGFYRRAQGDEVSDDIYHGVLSGYLIKPIHPLMAWCVRDCAIRLLELPVIAVVGIALVGVLPDEFRVAGVQPFSLLLIPIAWMLHFCLYTTLALLAFWLEQTWGERFVLNVVLEIASGAFVPLALFPVLWGDVLRMLPFSHLIATPIEFLLGMKTLARDYTTLLLMMGWVAASFIAMQWVWRRGLRRFEGVGM